ncbi:MAG: hypothetical protein QNJ26_15785 [Desulfobacterales bacterium]|nr:hypothetical protein [Desulfobacterales bacterium]
MKILHILRSEPDENTRAFIEQTFEDAQNVEVPLYEDHINYDALVTEIFSSDKVISWW